MSAYYSNLNSCLKTLESYDFLKISFSCIEVQANLLNYVLKKKEDIPMWMHGRGEKMEQEESRSDRVLKIPL